MKEIAYVFLKFIFKSWLYLTVNFSVLTFQDLDFINIHTIIWVVLIYFPDTFTSVWLKIQFPIPHMKLNGIFTQVPGL